MILLDTDVLSALMREVPDAGVVAWLDRQTADSVWTTAVTVFEVRFGLSRLPDGRRRHALEAAFDGLVNDDLAGRIAPLDVAAAEAAGRLAAQRQSIGRSVDMRDTLIAGIAIARRAAVATRNARHFDDLATGVVDPWTAVPER